MTTPDDRKTLQVNTAVHAAVYELSTELGTSVNGALAHLLDKSSIRVQVSEVQRSRWAAAAKKARMSLEEWIIHRIGAALENPPEVQRETLNQLFYRVDALCRVQGIEPPKPPRRPLKEK
jgi:hypothetical protein